MKCRERWVLTRCYKRKVFLHLLVFKKQLIVTYLSSNVLIQPTLSYYVNHPRHHHHHYHYHHYLFASFSLFHCLFIIRHVINVYVLRGTETTENEITIWQKVGLVLCVSAGADGQFLNTVKRRKLRYFSHTIRLRISLGAFWRHIQRQKETDGHSGVEFSPLLNGLKWHYNAWHIVIACCAYCSFLISLNLCFRSCLLYIFVGMHFFLLTLPFWWVKMYIWQRQETGRATGVGLDRIFIFVVSDPSILPIWPLLIAL